MHIEVATRPRTKTWTRQEFYQMAELGWFNGQRAELVEGEVLVLSPQNFRHSVTTDRTFRVIDRALGRKFWVRCQLPMQAGPKSEPEPDISVVQGFADDYSDHPTDAMLIVEISDTTLTFDRRRKASLYASRNVPDYWILNVIEEQHEVYRNPHPDLSAPSGSSYDEPLVFKRGDTVSPLADTTAIISVDELLGPVR